MDATGGDETIERVCRLEPSMTTKTTPIRRGAFATQNHRLDRRRILFGGTTLAAASALSAAAPVWMAQAQQPVPAQQPGRLPNVLAIMADDIGVSNVSAYHRGMMGGRTPNIDRIAREGALLI